MTAARQLEAERQQSVDPSTMVAETSDSMPTASISTCSCSPCCLYLSRSKITRASRGMLRNAVLSESHIITNTKSSLAFIKVAGIFFFTLFFFLCSDAQVTATGPHISKQCFLLFFFFSVRSLLLLLSFYKTPSQLVSVVSVLFQLNSLFFLLFYTSQL